jgi:tetraacyldisaccharide-1-P 4'-kinase
VGDLSLERDDTPVTHGDLYCIPCSSGSDQYATNETRPLSFVAPVFAFSGIARPASFLPPLEFTLGKELRIYSDHHPYDKNDPVNIFRRPPMLR